MDENFIEDFNLIEDKLGTCEKCGRELTESNIYPKSNRPLCKACAKEILEKKKAKQRTNKKESIIEKIKKLSKPKLITVISVASVFVLTAIILLCYFTIPVKVKMEDAKEAYRLALYETFKRDELTVISDWFTAENEPTNYTMMCSWDKNGDVYLTFKGSKNGTMTYNDGEYLSAEKKEGYTWYEKDNNGFIEEAAYWDKITKSFIDEYKKTIKDDIKYEDLSPNWNDFIQAYKRGGVTTIIFAGENSSQEEYKMTIKFEKDFIKSVEYAYEDQPYVETTKFKKRCEKIELNRDFERKEGCIRLP